MPFALLLLLSLLETLSPRIRERSMKEMEIDAAWAEHREHDARFRDKTVDLIDASNYEEYDWTADYDPWFECRQMWEEHENSHLLLETFYRKAYRSEPLPTEIKRYLRNDGIADWYEICVLKETGPR